MFIDFIFVQYDCLIFFLELSYRVFCFLFHRPLEMAHLSLLCTLVSLACSEAEQDSSESQFVILC